MASLIGRNRIDTDALKLAHPIGDVVARYGVELKRQGRAMVGRCIFHPDGGRPNLHIYADSESWRCYRCGIGGDVLAFVMHAEDIGFREAVDRLTGGRAVPVRPVPPSAPALRPAPRVLEERTAEELAVLQAATNFYHSNLLAEPRALDYLAQRGISLATARQYRLGYAAGDQLLAFLHWQRLPLGAALHRWCASWSNSPRLQRARNASATPVPLDQVLGDIIALTYADARALAEPSRMAALEL